MGGDGGRAAGVDQGAAGDDHRLDLGQILAGMHIAAAHGGIEGLQAAGMAGDGRFDGQRSQGEIQLFQLVVVGAGHHVGMYG